MPKNYREDSNYGLGFSPDQIVSLRSMDIAPPDQVTFEWASQYHTRSDLSRVGDGWSTAIWTWDVISSKRLAYLLSFLAGEDFANIYVQTDKRDGIEAQPRMAFGIYSAIMWKPVLAGQEGMPLVKSPYAMQTVQIKFLKLVLLPGYLPTVPTVPPA